MTLTYKSLRDFRTELKFIGLQPLHLLDDSWSMEKVNDLQTGRHCVFMMHVHLVFVAKYRRGLFTKQVLADLQPIFAYVCKKFEAKLVEFDGEDDHVHLLVTYPPKIAVSVLVNSLKGVPSRRLRQQNNPHFNRKLRGAALWSPSYFAGSCGGAPLDILKQYIEKQRTPG